MNALVEDFKSFALRNEGPEREIPIDAYCVVCGFKLGWRLVLGGRQREREAREQGRGLWGKSP